MANTIIQRMTSEECEHVVAWIVGRMHVSASDKGVRSNVGRRLIKTMPKADRVRLLDAAVRVHHKNRAFYTNNRFGVL